MSLGQTVVAAALVLLAVGCGGSAQMVALADGASAGGGQGGGLGRGGGRPGEGSGGDPGTGLDGSPVDEGSDAGLVFDTGSGDAPGLADAPSHSDGPSADGGNDAPPADPCASCQMLRSDYAAAYQKAQSCAVGSSSCVYQSETMLGCDCQGWVTSLTTLDPYKKRWQAEGCDKCATCSKIRCIGLTGKGGACQSNLATTNASDPGLVSPGPILRVGTCTTTPL